jgi:hypothetical protein
MSRTSPRTAVWNAITALAIIAVLFVTFYGLNAQRQASTTAQAPGATGTVPPQTTGQGGAQTTSAGGSENEPTPTSVDDR